MRFIEIISKLENIDEFSMIFIKSNNGKITRASEALILEFTESEMDKKAPSEIAKEKCPGYKYFMEAYSVK